MREIEHYDIHTLEDLRKLLWDMRHSLRSFELVSIQDGSRPPFIESTGYTCIQIHGKVVDMFLAYCQEVNQNYFSTFDSRENENKSIEYDRSYELGYVNVDFTGTKKIERIITILERKQKINTVLAP